MPLLRPRDLLRMATIEAATVLGLGDRIGSLAPGKQADIVLVRKDAFGGALPGDPCDHVLLQAGTRDVDTVLVAGTARVRHGRVLGFDADRARKLAADSHRSILAAA